MEAANTKRLNKLAHNITTKIAFKPSMISPYHNLSLCKFNKDEQSGVIYGVKCKSCTEKYIYIGETARFLIQRAYSHLHKRTSPVRNHIDTKGHRAIDFEIIAYQA